MIIECYFCAKDNLFEPTGTPIRMPVVCQIGNKFRCSLHELRM
jgi:hypothetical protein